jgi:hypothetical protein
MIDLCFSIQAGVAQHLSGDDDNITVYSVVGLGQIDIPGIGQLMRANRPQVHLFIVNRAAAVDVKKFIVKKAGHDRDVVLSNSFDATAFEGPQRFQHFRAFIAHGDLGLAQGFSPLGIASDWAGHPATDSRRSTNRKADPLQLVRTCAARQRGTEARGK